MDDLLLQTKFHIPTAPHALVTRPHLLTRLAGAFTRRVTLIAAPAGFGKTTLVATSLATLTATVPVGQLVPQPCWLTLDEADNDPQRFFLYWIGALQRAVPHGGEQARTLLLAAQATSCQTLLTVLLNELAVLTTPVVLVLDDYHLITTTAIHEALAFMVDHLPPTLHLLITSRTEPPLPWARWRVRGYLAELRGVDLRFSQGEIAEFFNQVAGLSLRPAQREQLAARTEGWVAALQLVALSLPGQTDIDAFLDNFTGGQRQVVDYLVDEVLRQQPPATQHFLLYTSILSRLCASLCAALLAENPYDFSRADPALSTAQAMLEDLERRQLFLVPLDGDRQWYRYHALFAEFLRHRLGEQAVRLHRRAAAWYAAHGYVEETITHALAAHDYPYATALIEAHGLPFALRNQLTTVEGWLQALPATLYQQSPALTITNLWVAMGRGDSAAMTRALQQVDAALVLHPSVLDATLQSTADAARALVASFQQDHATTIRYAQQALAGLPPAAQLLRLAAISGLGYGYYCAGDLLQAERTLRPALLTQPQALEQIFIHSTMLAMLAMTVEMQGRLQEAVTLYRRALQLTRRQTADDEHYLPLPGVAVALHGMALRLYEFNALDEARHYGEFARRLSATAGNQMVYGHALATLALIAQARGALAEAQAQIDEGYAVLQGLAVPSAAVVESQRVFLWCKRGHLVTAGQWAARFVQTMPSRPQPMTAFASVYCALARIWIAQERFDEADQLLADLYAAAAAGHYHYYLVWTRILQSESQTAQGNQAAAIARLAEALTLAAPAGYIRTFVDEGAVIHALLLQVAQRPLDNGLADYLDQLLAAFDAPARSKQNAPTSTLPPMRHPPLVLVAPLIEALSERELEVLQLLAHGHSNQAIADQLVVALSTVKKHLVHIYGKLAVTSRTQAVNRARELQLL